MRRPEGVPQREGSVVALTAVELMNLFVHTPITAVDIVEQHRADRSVIERSIKDPPMGFVRSRNLDARELAIPLLACAAANPLKVPLGNLCLQIICGRLRADP